MQKCAADGGGGDCAGGKGLQRVINGCGFDRAAVPQITTTMDEIAAKLATLPPPPQLPSPPPGPPVRKGGKHLLPPAKAKKKKGG